MAVDISELVGPDNMTIERKDAVISLLQNLPTTATSKRYLFGRWARIIGFHPSKEDLNKVAPWSQ